MAARDPGGEKHAVFFYVSLNGLSERETARRLMERDSTVLPTETYARNATSSTTSALYSNPRVHREARKTNITSANKNNQRSRPKRYIKKPKRKLLTAQPVLLSFSSELCDTRNK